MQPPQKQPFQGSRKGTAMLLNRRSSHLPRKWRDLHAFTQKSISQRVMNLKASLPPVTFFSEEVEQFTPRREQGWVNTGLCPFHPDTRPGSFSVNLDSGAFRCFSCGAAGGDIIAFYRLRYDTNFTITLEDLESRVEICR